MDVLPPLSPWVELGSRLNRADRQHLYRQVAQLVREQVRTGKLQSGDLLPSQRELSAMWGVGEVTVRRALQELADEGLLEARAGSGTMVRDPETTRTAHGDPRPLTCGVAFADLTDGYPFFAPVLTGLRSGGSRVAVRLFDMPPQEQASGSLAHPPPLGELDALVMMSPVNLGLLALCQRRRLPTVLLFSDVADGFSHCLIPDYGIGVAEAVRHLRSRGRRRIAFVSAGAERFSTGRWTDAFRMALQMSDLPADPRHIVHAGYSEAAGAAAVRRLLALDEPPDAILFASDHMARGALLMAHEAGVRVPADLAIIGAGPVLGEGGWTVPLTTIDLGLEAMGEQARAIIESARRGDEPRQLRQTIPTKLAIGSTS